MALANNLDAVPGTTRDPPPTALPILPDVIGLPTTVAELIRENGRLAFILDIKKQNYPCNISRVGYY